MSLFLRIFFLTSFCLSVHLSDIWFFTYFFYCGQEIFSCSFSFLCFRFYYFYYYYYLLYVYVQDYKRPLLAPSKLHINNQFYTIDKHRSTMDRFWAFSKKNNQCQRKLSMKKNLDLLRLKSQFGIFLGYLKLTIWHFLRMKNRECSMITIRN